MKLRHSPTSPYVRKVLVLAIETGLRGKLELVPTMVVPSKPNQEVAQDNPLVKIPSLTTDDGTVLYDSPVICEYLDSLHGGARMFPVPGAARWTALRRQALGDGILDAAILARYEVALRPQGKQWDEWLSGQLHKVRTGLDALEAEAGSFGAGVDIGLITIACALGYLDLRFADEQWGAKRPTLAAWHKGFNARPSMRDTAPSA